LCFLLDLLVFLYPPLVLWYSPNFAPGVSRGTEPAIVEEGVIVGAVLEEHVLQPFLGPD